MEMYMVPLTLLLLLLLSCSCTDARPQDLESSMLLAVAQMQQLVESGAAARNEHSVEVLGQRMGGATSFGFGDALRPPIGRRRRRQVELTLMRRPELNPINA
ncbi:uncharacterized protein LOC108657484 [Drosophila navojoa]|uniref:uncharacterized protein LOC108657484 n=1 Tax=Drosophila navojoa TaxID=7232 RepID=UPI000846E65B|nr:uncharacterized protein LOC108657484 [Drosophila navojoa]